MARAQRVRAGRWPALCISLWTAATLGPATILAQAPLHVSGRVVDADGEGVTAVRVTLELRTPERDVRTRSATTGRDGAFEFRVDVHEDDDAEIVVSALHQGVEYSLPPLLPPAGARAQGIRDLRLTVYDTALVESEPALLSVSTRHVLVKRSGEFNAEVTEIIDLSNPTRRTWAAGAGRGLWEVALPDHAESASIGGAPRSASGVRLRGDTVTLAGPLPPGRNEVAFRYFLSAKGGPYEIQLGAPTDHLELLVESRLGPRRIRGLEERGSILINGEPFRRFVGRRVRAETRVEFSLAPGFGRRLLLRALPALLFVLLVGGASLVRLRRSRALAPGQPEN